MIEAYIVGVWIALGLLLGAHIKKDEPLSLYLLLALFSWVLVGVWLSYNFDKE